MKINALAAALVIFGFGVAHAADTGGSEYFHQSGTGVSEVTPHLSWTMMTEKHNSINGAAVAADFKQSGIRHLGVSYEYGINEMFAVYGDIATSMINNDFGPGASATTSGLDDINLGVKGTSAMGMGNLRYGLNLNIGLDKYKFDKNGIPTNNSSGGTGLTPYIGWDMVAGPGMWGARLSYDYVMDRTLSADGTTSDIKWKGGNVLGIGTFYEYMMADMTFGGKLQFDTASDIKQTVGSSAETTSGYSSGTLLTLGVYTRIGALGPGALLAGVDYMTLASNKPAGVDGRNGVAINLGYRIAF